MTTEREKLAALKADADRANRDLAVANTASYYAHRTYLQSKNPEALKGYQAALARCQRAVEAVIATDKALSEALGQPHE